METPRSRYRLGMGSAARALIRFHHAAGLRVALRASAIVGAIVVFVFGSAPEALATLRAFILGVVGFDRAWGSRAVFAGFCVALAAVAAPRVTLGTTGWMRSLAASAATQRRAALFALCSAQAFALIFFVLASAATVVLYGKPVSVPKVASIPVLVVAAACLVLPVRRRAARLLPLAALIVVLPGRWLLAGLAVVLLAAFDLLCGEIVRTQRGGLFASPLGALRGPALLSWVRMTWRALPFGRVFGGAMLPAMFVGYAYFIVLHNPDLSSVWVARTIRICGALGLAAFVAALGNVVLRGRPPWSWSRSLPWSSAQRVAADAIALGVPFCLVPLALVPLDIAAALSVAAMVPAVAALTAAALRVGASRQTGAAGESVVLTLAMGAGVVLWPVTWIVVLCLVPVFVRWGAARERAAVTTRWVELQHYAAGDPAWMDAP
ncbi:MAG: hypothetical protein ABI877_08500 [Gemmatimonadaceae bacterium]